MTRMAADDRLDAIRRAEGSVTAQLAPVFKVIEREGVYRLEAPKDDPEPDDRHPIVYGRMAGWAMIAAAIAIFITFTILSVSQGYLNSIGG